MAVKIGGTTYLVASLFQQNSKSQSTALYFRLSRDDELQGDSNSIQNQEKILQIYADDNGLVFCADSKSRDYHIRGTTLTEGQTNYICGAYRKKGKEVCTAHFIRPVVLDEVVLQDLRRVTAFAKEHIQEFIKRQMVCSKKRTRRKAGPFLILPSVLA